MALNQGSIATHAPQSLPSFAQAFSSTSLDRMSPASTSVLPPIQSRHPHNDSRRVQSSPPPKAHSRLSDDKSPPPVAGRKRARTENKGSGHEDEHSDSGHDTHIMTKIKEEPDVDIPQRQTPPPTESDPKPPYQLLSGETSATSATPSPMHKKRRVTISGMPRLGTLNTDVRAPADQTNSTPISPVVIGFTIERDNPSAVEQVRSMLTVKQKQKALIEQRRGSVAGIVSSGSMGTPSISIEDRAQPPPKASSSGPSRPTGRNSNTNSTTKRTTNGKSSGTPSPPLIVPSQQPASQSQSAVNSHSLAPPPISFARRRANQLAAIGKKKPADILISPREDHTPEQLAPSIQSAPPIPHGPGASNSGRFPMTLPRLPSALGGENVRRAVGGIVPPTPTRLGSLRDNAGPRHPIPGIAGRSPPTASIPISSTHVPATPSALHHPGYSGDKSAFLAPFEMFYDALNDSKQLKTWLGEQMQRSNALMHSLTQQQEKMHEMVEAMVEKRMQPMRMEMVGLYRRIEELEDALRDPPGRRGSFDAALVPHRGKGKQPHRNGPTSSPRISESYTFPPVPPVERERRRVEHHDRWPQDRERDTMDIDPEPSQESRRMSLSSSRHDRDARDARHPYKHSDNSGTPPRNQYNAHSPPHNYRDLSHPLPPPGRLVRGNSGLGRNRSPRMSGPGISNERDRDISPLPMSRNHDRQSSEG